MSRRRLSLLAAAALIWLSAGAVARAEYLDWSYTWDRSPFAVSANGGAKLGVVSIALPPLPTGGGPGGSPIAPLVLSAATFAQGTAASPADLYQNASYSVTLNVTDNQTQQSHAFVFQGFLNGSMTKGLVALTSTFQGGDQQSFTISGRLYTVTLAFTAPQTDTTTFAGTIGASVDVADGVTDPPPQLAPEPAGLLLAALALPAVGLAAGRRIRRAAPPPGG